MRKGVGAEKTKRSRRNGVLFFPATSAAQNLRHRAAAKRAATPVFRAPVHAQYRIDPGGSEMHVTSSSGPLAVHNVIPVLSSSRVSRLETGRASDASNSAVRSRSPGNSNEQVAIEYEIRERTRDSIRETVPRRIGTGRRSQDVNWSRMPKLAKHRLLKMLLQAIVLILSARICHGNPDAKRLYDDLLSNYNRLIRPVSNNNDTVVVKLGLRLSQLIDLNLKDQILTTNVWLEHEWQDHKFQWDPTEYGGVTELYVPSEHIWLPDIVLYNNADGEYGVTTMTKAILHYTGKVLWTPPAIFKSSCEIDVRYFPFDQQTCFMKFGSWTYDGIQIDLKHINQGVVGDKVDVGIDLREYYPSVEWDILGVPAERHKKYYPCCDEPYPDIFFNITLRRKTLFYTVNLIVPCVSISYLSVLAFYLPADSGEKIALCINILLSQTMFFLLISEIIPSTSLALPLLGKYLLFTMILVAFSVVVTIVILNVHYRKPSTHKMAPWIRKIFIRRLPKLLLMRVPDDLLIDLAAHKIHGRGRSGKKSKFNAAVAAAVQSSPIISSPDSARHQQIGGCNGLHTTTAHNRFLGGLGGYNGLPTVMSGLDESLSDVTPKKKYPFELEKALHNVMFIQHHIQRQDEFNAEDQDWGFVAMVLDRLFLWIFTIASIVGTFVILCEAPALRDNTKPIDMEYSSVAQQQYLPQDNLLENLV